MRHLLLTLLALLIFIPVFGQTPAPEQDCPNAIPVCQPVYQQNKSYAGVGVDTELNSSNEGCLLAGEKNDVWYVINVSSPGSLAFVITPNNLADDYDFALWDVTGVGCSAIFNYITKTPNNYPPAACNFSGVAGATGLNNVLAALPGNPQWSNEVTVTAGQTFVLNVSNFSSTASGYKLDFSSATASIYDTVKPKVRSIYTRCQYPSDTLLVTISEPIKCNSITSSASEWTITPAGSPQPVAATGVNCFGINSTTNSISLALSSILAPGNYYLHLANGTDNNTLLDNCGNAADTITIPFSIASPDSPKIVAVDTPACIRTRIYLSAPVSCSSVARDGSDFTITGPSPVTIVHAEPASCSSSGMTDTIDIFFARSIYVPGIYTIGFKTGTDGNSLVDTCGKVAAGTFNFVVSDKGYLKVTAIPGVLCYPGYANLFSAVSIPPPPQEVICGTNNSTCGGPVSDYTPTIGNSSGTTVNSPLYSSVADSRTQMLFQAGELLGAGLTNGIITRLGINITSLGGPFPYDNFTVKMGCTNLTSLTGFVPSLPVVFNPQSFYPAVGTNTIPLDYNYDWDGKSNLIVEICYHNNSVNPSADAVLTSANVFPGAVYHTHVSGGSTAGCALASNQGTPVSSNARPVITFGQCKPPTGTHTYLWSPSNYLNDSSAANTFGYVPQTTAYSMQIMDSNYCYRRDTATVIVSVRHANASSDTAICIGESIQLHAAGGLSYSWNPATGLSCANCTDPVAGPTVTTTYAVSIADQYNCADTFDVNVRVKPLPKITVFPHDTTIVYGQQLKLFLTSPPQKSIMWSPVSGVSDPQSPSPIVAPLLATTYVASVIDTAGCVGHDSARIGLLMEVPVNIPSAFTPNGDGLNDRFGVFNLTTQKVIEFRVFNRWGNEVFSTQSGKESWDGTYKGEPQPQGVYQYLIRISWPSGRTARYQGDVTLVR